MIDLILDNKEWLFSGLGIYLLTIIFKKDNTEEPIININNNIVTNEKINPEKPILEKSYSQMIGYNHKILREEIFKFTKREMSEFYNLQSVRELEEYENGIVELPFSLIKKLEEFFNINSEYLELSKKPIFNTFYLSSENILKLLDDGFSPIIACSPINRRDLFAYIVMYKKENNFTRIIISDTEGSFMSNGGGRMNIESLIHAMIKRNIDKYSVRIITIKENELKLINNGIFYQKDLFRCFGCADHTCQDIFNQWYSEIKNLKTY